MERGVESLEAGSMPAGDSLRDQVRRRLSAKDLFLASRPGRPERGSGNSCEVCGSAITTTGVQYTVRGPTTSIVVHLGYLVWRQESEAARLRGER
jgi:hypothetical protein